MAAMANYYDVMRKDVLQAIPCSAKVVLSVGCAAGRTEAELVKRGMTVVGVEIHEEAANLARQRGLVVIQGDAVSVDVSKYGPYDCIVYADVLEHLVDPQGLVRRHIDSLKDDGIVYATVPNFRNFRVFYELFIRGAVRYEDAGILDRTHVRITTRKLVCEWLAEVGLAVVTQRFIIWGRRNKLLSVCLLGLAREFIAHQVAFVATKSL